MLLALVLAGAIIAAVSVRIREAPYRAYLEGREVEANEALSARAWGGNGLAAFLVAKNFEKGRLGPPSADEAMKWYLNAAELGESRAIAFYLNLIALNQAPSPQTCRFILSALDRAGRAAEPMALITLSRYHEVGFCTQPDLEMAARYSLGAARIDGRLHDHADRVIARLDPERANALSGLPDRFDVTAADALAYFLTDVAPKTRMPPR